MTPDTNLALDLGVDSLQWLDLTLALRERAHVDLPEDRIAELETVRHLLRRPSSRPRPARLSTWPGRSSARRRS